MTLEFNFKNLCMKPNEITMIIYHDKCIDGFTSALCSYIYFNSEHKIKYVKGSFDMNPPSVTNENVLICDFSYNKQIMAQLLVQANKLVILDHHKSAEDDLVDLPIENKIFCSKYSGAFITWKYFFPNDKIPKLIKYVQDNDLWQFKLSNTKQIISYISTLLFRFQDYEKLLDDNYLDEIQIIGQKIMDDNDKYVSSKVNEAHILFMQFNDKYYMVPHVQSYKSKSDIGHMINTIYKNIDFCAIYAFNKEKNKTFFSLRSNDNNIDTTIISSQFNGGGHRNSSGFILDNSHKNIPGLVIDKNIYNLLKNIKIKEINLNSNSSCYGIILNCKSSKEKIGKYFLQKRNYNNQNVQQGVYIHQNNTGEYIDKTIKCSILWHERKDNNTFIVTIVSEKYLVDDFKNIFVTNNINYNIKNDVISCTIPSNNIVSSILF